MGKVVKIISIHDQTSDYEYWMSKTITERFEAIEFLRKQYSTDYDPTSRIQKVCTITTLSKKQSTNLKS
jgi:hypothetical protein